MSINKIVNKIKTTRVIAIDPSSHSLAWCVADVGFNTFKLVGSGKIDFKDKKEINLKFKEIKTGINSIWEEYQFKDAVIEQSVYIQNFQSSRIISYVIGYSWGILDEYCLSVCDVNPLVWKPKIGYKNLSKADKLKIERDFGQKGIQKKLSQERKDRVKNIIEAKIGESTDDEDVNDAIGIALWYYIDHGYGAL